MEHVKFYESVRALATIAGIDLETAGRRLQAAVGRLGDPTPKAEEAQRHMGGDRTEYPGPDWSKAPDKAQYAYRFDTSIAVRFDWNETGQPIHALGDHLTAGKIVAIHMRPKIRDDCPVMYDYEDHEGCTGWSRFDCLPSYATNVRVLIDKDTVLKMTAWLFDLIGCCDTEPREAQAKLSAAIDRYASGENHE